MTLTGKELHSIYAEMYYNLGVWCETWEELEERDRKVWEALANKLGVCVGFCTQEEIDVIVERMIIAGLERKKELNHLDGLTGDELIEEILKD